VPIDWDKVDEVTLALLNLTSFEEHGIVRSWKGHDWDVMNRLHEQSRALFAKHFAVDEDAK
jgi:hypothetical protein